MTSVVLLRHGSTEANEKGLYCGKTDIPLSLAGRLSLLRLRAEQHYPDIGGFKVFTSGMLRAEETLRLIYGETGHCIEPGFREMSFGQFEMRSYEELKRLSAYSEWCSGDNEKKRCPDGESGIEMKARVLDSYKKLLLLGANLLIICHGGPISAIMEHVFSNERKSRYEWQPASGTGYLISYDNALPVSYIKIPELLKHNEVK